jgi:thiosulfate/3-mercaptopyruvate sulfurtransferase
MSTILAALALTAAGSGLLVTPAELAARLKDPSLVVLAVGVQPGDFELAHIPGARLIAYDQIAVDGPDGLGSELPPVEELRAVFAAAGVTAKSQVVIYGSPISATRAFFTLDYLGHPNVRLLNGGISAWKTERLPLEQGAARPLAAPKLAGGSLGSEGGHPERIASAAWIQERLSSSKMTLIDARPDAEFTGSDGGMGGMHAVGHLPGAQQQVWDTLVDRSGRFAPDAELRAKMQAAGAVAGTPVVSYCMVGMRASVTYFVARHLGYDAKLYDGSIVDWGKRKLPTKTGR